jgi:hypothetical protein
MLPTILWGGKRLIGPRLRKQKQATGSEEAMDRDMSTPLDAKVC